MSSCSACPAPAIPRPLQGTEESQTWAKRSSAPPTPLLQQIQLFYGISANYCTGLCPNFDHLHLKEGKKIKKAANGNAESKSRGFQPRVLPSYVKVRIFYSNQGGAVGKSNIKMALNNSFWLIRKNPNTTITQNLSVCKIWAAQFWEEKRRGLGNGHAVLFRYSYKHWQVSEFSCLTFLPQTPLILCRTPDDTRRDVNSACPDTHNVSNLIITEKWTKSLPSDSSWKGLWQMVYLAWDFPKDPGDWVPNSPKPLSGSCFSFNNPT